MKLFIVDSDTRIDYDEFLENILSSECYVPNFQCSELFPYFANLIKAFITNSPVTLIDSDFSQDEIGKLGINDVNVPVKISIPSVKGFDELLDLLHTSSSEIEIYTSGTTGQPKKIQHTYQSLSRAVRRGVKYENDIWGYAYNPTHMAGLQVFLQILENRNTLINIFNKGREEIFGKIKDFGITHISATPTFYRMLLPADTKFDSVQRVTFGGEKSNEKLYNGVQTLFPNAKITNIYASTEAGTLFASHGSDFVIPAEMRDKFRVENRELLIHRSLLGRSPQLNIIDEFYHSGDLIEWVDESNGVFRFVSRKNELINVGGYKVNPQEVEDTIRRIDGVKDVHVFGRANSVLGNILCADVVKDNSTDVSEMAIRQFLSTELQDFKIPRRIKFRENLEVTRTGKMKRL